MAQIVTNEIKWTKNIRASKYDSIIFNTKWAYIKADTLNYPTWFPAWLLLQADWDFLKAYEWWDNVPVWVLVDPVTIEDYKRYINWLSGNINWTNWIWISVDFKGKFVKANIIWWDDNAKTKLEARELENWTVVQF